MSRMFLRPTCLAALVVACLASARATAQTVPAPPLSELLESPDALVSWLATHSHDAQAEAARVSQAQAAYLASGLRPNPQLSASLGGIPAGTTNPPGLGFGDSVNYGASVSQLFEVAKRRPRREAARFRVDAEQHTLSGALLAAVGDAREAIARVLYAKSRKATLAEELETSRQLLALQRVRLDRGDLSGIDFDRMQLDTQMLEADLAQASAELGDSLSTCASVLFARCDPGDAALDVVVRLLQTPDVALPDGWEASLSERPDLQSLDALQQAAQQDGLLARGRRLPDPVVSLGYTRDRFVISGNNPRTLMLGVTIPLPAFDRGQHDVARAAAEGRELRETAAGALARAASDTLGLRDRQAALVAALDAVQRDALSRANAVLTATADAVNHGELSTTDLLLARRARTDVTLRVLDLQLQLFLVQNELRQVLGLDAPTVRRIQGATWPTP